MSKLDQVVMRSDDIELTVLPGAGARMHSLRVRGSERLRVPSDPAQHFDEPFFWGGYVMAPWANRIAPGAIEVGERTVDLKPNFEDGSAIHGQVYVAAWEQSRGSGDRATFQVERDGDGWPWRYQVEIDYAVVGMRVDVTQRLRNISDAPMPGGIGLHPWFPTPVETRISSGLTYGSNKDAAAQPYPVSGDLDLRTRQPLAVGVDASWADPADPAFELFWPDGVHAQIHATHPTLHVVAAYAPERGAIAVEPETNAPQPLHRLLDGLPGGLSVLDPGAELVLPIVFDFDAEGRHPSPAPDYFDALIARALDNLPPEFRAQLDSVAIVIDDYPTPQQLAATHSYGLFGIYEGVPRTAYGAEHVPYASKITLVRGTLEAYSSSIDDLALRVEDTLFHEIAHHMGISDARLRELAAQRRHSSH